jgi:hypothetical protein
MTVFFNVVTHLLIILGVAGMFAFVGLMIKSEDQWLEKIIKTLAMVAGFLIYFGAKAVGISIPAMMLASVQNTNPIVFGFFGLVLPSAAGIFISWYCMKNMRRSEVIASRIVILISAFIAVMFGDVYASSYQVETLKESMNAALLPNLTFVVGLTLYVVFKYEAVQPAGRGKTFVGEES